MYGEKKGWKTKMKKKKKMVRTQVEGINIVTKHTYRQSHVHIGKSE